MRNLFSGIDMIKISKSFLLTLAVAVLAGCGAGGGSGTSTGTSGASGVGTTTTTYTQKITGTAATGAALANATVTVKDSTGALKTTTTSTSGTFSVDVTGMTQPFMLEASTPSDGSLGLYLYSGLPTLTVSTTANTTANVNITPVTTLVMYQLYGSNPANMFSDFTNQTSKLTATAVSTAKSAVQTNLSTILAGTALADLNTVINQGINVMTDSFAVGGVYDTALDNIGNIISYPSSGGVTLKTTATASSPYVFSPGSSGTSATVGTVGLTTGATSIPAGGGALGTTLVTAKVTDTTGAVMSGITVNFTTSAGTLANITSGTVTTSATTNGSGIAQVNLISDSSSSTTITANANGIPAATPVTVTFVSPAAIGMNLTPSTVLPGGITTLTIVATDGNGKAVGAGQIINFSDNSAGGKFNSTSGTTDANGAVSVTYTVPATAIPGSVLLTATAASNKIYGTTNLAIVSNVISFGSITVASTAPSIAAVGGSTTLTATVTDSSNNPISGANVTFYSTEGTVTGGNVSANTSTTTVKGIATATLTSTSNPISTAIVTAGYNGYITAVPAKVNFVAGTPNAIGLNAAPNTAIPGGASSKITAAVVDINGNPVAGDVLNFSFVGTRGTNGLITIGSGTPTLVSTGGTTSATTDVNGLATITYTPGANAGVDTVQAVDSYGKTSSTTTITVANNAKVVGSVVAAASKPSIPVGGSTSYDTITATVKDTTGAALANQTVTFTTSAGTLTSTSGSGLLVTATTDSSGFATATLVATGTSLATATVSAAVGGYTSNIVNVAFIAGQAVNITVGAAPTAVSTNGTSTITAYVTDVNSNPVTGEPVTFAFTSTGRNSGNPSISNTTVNTVNGLASVVYTAGATGGSDIISATISNGTPAPTPATITSSAATIAVNGVTLTPGATIIPAGGASGGGSTALVAVVTPAMANVKVYFSTSAGTLTGGSTDTSGYYALTGATGAATVTLNSSNNLGAANIQANASGFVATTTVNFTAANPSSVTLLASSTSISSGSTSNLTAVVLDANNNPVSNQTVTFAVSGVPAYGTISPVTALTSVNGIAGPAVYTAGSTAGTDKVVATLTSGTASQPVSLTVVAGLSASTLSIGTSKTSLKSDNSTSATITVTATNANNVLVSGVPISFSSPDNTTGGASVRGSISGTTLTVTFGTGLAAGQYITGSGVTQGTQITNLIGACGTYTCYTVTPSQSVSSTTINQITSKGGTLSALSAVTNGSGQATVTVSSGTADQSDRTITVTASSPGVTNPSSGQVSIPIQITGSTITLTPAATGLVSAAPPGTPTSTTMTVQVSNAGGVGVYNVPVQLTVSSGAGVTLSTASGPVPVSTNIALDNTDVNGQLVVTVTGVNTNTSGTPTVKAIALGAIGTQSFTVSTSGSQFAITSPSANPATLQTNTSGSGGLLFNVQVGSNPAIVNIQLSTSIGTWNVCGLPVCTVAAGSPAAYLNSPLSGVASVLVNGLDASGNVVATDSRKVAISSANATTISLLSSANVVPPSSGTSVNTATITASVLDSGDQPVGNAPVLFSLMNPAGGGETVSPSLVLSSNGSNSTNSIGQATTTFTSGSTPTGASGETIVGRVVGSGNGTCPTDVEAIVTGSISTQASGTGSISGTTLNVTTLATGSGPLAVGQYLSGSGIASGTYITAMSPTGGLTGNGGTGTYTVNNSQTVGSVAISVNTLNVTSVASGTLSVGQSVTGTGVVPGTQIVAMNPTGALTGTGLTGTYYVASNSAVQTIPVATGTNITATAGTTGTAICGTTNVVIGQTVGSIVIGRPTTISTVPTDTTNTTYELTMNLLVSDSNGNPVPNAVVSLNVWPVYFRTGIYQYDKTLTPPCYTTTYAEFPNEDTNKNLILDAGEALTTAGAMTAAQITGIGSGTPGGWATPYIVENTQLIPAPSAAGNVPATVTTDSNGLANFNLIYLKQYASWIVDQITATTQVQGTETSSSLTFVLDKTITDMSGTTCVLPDSPWNTQ